VATTIGVIGGGQLARMMIPPAIALGVNIRVLAEVAESSAALAATQVGDYRDRDTVLAFANTVDVITFDHEHVPQHVLAALVEAGHSLHPSPEALFVAQDKIVMRTRLAELGLPIPDWAAVSNAAELATFLAAHGNKAVLKTARGGYDGKGVRVIDHVDQAADWFAALAEDGHGGALLVEEFVPFTRELAQLIARRPSGEVAAWPVVETVQREGVCAEVLAPAPNASAELIAEANRIATEVANGLGVTGVLAVELFETEDGRLLINELAMRPHNSGHFTIDGSVTSQFEQHLRAVADLPLGSTELTAPAVVMVNVLGGPAEGTMDVRYPQVMAAHPAAKLHSYAKQPRPGRKVGHVTVTGDEMANTRAEAQATAAMFA